MKAFIGILFTFLTLGLSVAASPLWGVEDTSLAGTKYFKIRIQIPINSTLSDKHYMDIKDGVMGFGRDGEDFEAYINGTKQGNSYLITRQNGYGFLLEDEAPRYDFRVGFHIPPTDFKAYWAVQKNVLTCHLLTKGFKYFPDPHGGYVIRWDTRDDMGTPFYMWVEWCRR